MSIQTSLVAVKAANATLVTLIGTRFHPDVFPQEVVMPAVRFTQVSKVDLDYCFAGRPQVSTVRVQMDGIAASSTDRTTLRAALIEAFLPATRITGTYGGEYIFDIRVDNAISAVDRLDDESEAWRTSMDLICDFRWSAGL